MGVLRSFLIEGNFATHCCAVDSVFAPDSVAAAFAVADGSFVARKVRQF